MIALIMNLLHIYRGRITSSHYSHTLSPHYSHHFYTPHTTITPLTSPPCTPLHSHNPHTTRNISTTSLHHPHHTTPSQHNPFRPYHPSTTISSHQVHVLTSLRQPAHIWFVEVVVEGIHDGTWRHALNLVGKDRRELGLTGLNRLEREEQERGFELTGRSGTGLEDRGRAEGNLNILDWE
ncbi:hypothetical protein Pcinc_036567 [Petrolisthes cinctipes]|uniref:Uncharacterized protein n=1 Tax=Petrolisthes cinctipes TaxID=88211 RepID=A0AAE1EM83_PETCI|nr:hypothetical protein Pcinc_036567 [Petrolisthes cinctipes]